MFNDVVENDSCEDDVVVVDAADADDDCNDDVNGDGYHDGVNDERAMNVNNEHENDDTDGLDDDGDKDAAAAADDYTELHKKLNGVFNIHSLPRRLSIWPNG